MTTFNTGNPLGSTDVYDRYDNSENLDNFSNGPLDAYPDRFGVSRQSLQGIRNASQYVVLGPYAAGLNFTALNQVFSYDAGSGAEFYAPGPSITLPYTTTGAGAGEIANFRSVGDATLRSDMANSADPAKGAALVGFSSETVYSALTRALASNTLDTTRIDVPSADTVNLTASAPNTRHINITGATTITAFTVAVGRCYFVRFAGTLTLTNNASIVTQSGANITTAAGDTCILRATAANVVEVLAYTPVTALLDTTRIDVPSADTVNLTASAPNTRHINITGATTITAFTVAVGRCYFVRFSSALTLTSGASLVTQSGANIKTAAGDTCIIRATSDNTVELLGYTPGIPQEVGYRQDWQNLSGSRTSGTIYTNTTGRSILVLISGTTTSSSQGVSSFSVGGVEIFSGNLSTQGVYTAFKTGAGSFLVPAGATYSSVFLYNSNLNWSELR